ncbi:MAG: flavodoxin family protein [Desulfovibrio sp.]|jgi:multimeric flavodoxin WrbA|nr:flavodoxin family protein [Desulfovibrio sp.]
MKVLVIHGSRRKQGNSSFLANKFVECLGSRNTDAVYLADLHYKGCSGCMTCRKKSEECVMQDELSPVLAAVKEADVTVLAAPIYQEYVNGDMKCLLDRFFSYLGTDHFQRLEAGETDLPTRLGQGKCAVMILSQGQPETLYPYLADSLNAVLRETGFTHVHIVRCCRLNSAKDSRSRPDLFDRLASLAKEIRASRRSDFREC